MKPDRDIRSRVEGPNVPRAERVASVVLGGALVAFGVSRKSLSGALLAIAGGALVGRGATGRCGVYRMRAVRKGISVRRSVTVQASPSEIYELWRDLRNLPRFMAHVSSIELEDNNISHWTVREGGKRLEWRAEITEDTPGHRLRWRSLPGGDLDHEGTLDLRAAPGDRGTIVEVKMLYRPPGGVVTSGLLNGFLRKLPGLQLEEELMRLRMLVETGELATGASHRGKLAANEKVLLAAGVV